MPDRTERAPVSVPLCAGRADRADCVRLTSYPYDTPTLQAWLNDLHHPGQVIATFDLLNNLNTHIYRSLKYAHRDEPGVQLPHDTLALGSGSCRDFAVLMMESAVYWGFGPRVVTGSTEMDEGQHGLAPARRRISLPGTDQHGLQHDGN